MFLSDDHVNTSATSDEMDIVRAYETIRSDSVELGTLYKKLVPGSKPENIRFTHNPLHECESLWWITMFFIVVQELATPSDGWERDAQRIQVDKIFPTSLGDGRGLLLTNFSTFRTLLSSLDPTMEIPGESLGNIRQSLVDAYKTAEKALPGGKIDPSVWNYESQLHIQMASSFGPLIKSHTWMPMRPLRSSQEIESSKRHKKQPIRPSSRRSHLSSDERVQETDNLPSTSQHSDPTPCSRRRSTRLANASGKHGKA